MRTSLLILAFISVLSSSAQTHLPVDNVNYAGFLSFPAYHFAPWNSDHANQKWYLTQYVGISGGYGYFNGAGISTFSVPIGLQLNHPLNNNLTAFASVSAGPTFYNITSFASPGYNTFYPGTHFSNGYGLGINTRVDMGLMYTNDAKTFSISGSIGVDRYSYPIYPSGRVNPGGYQKK